VRKEERPGGKEQRKKGRMLEFNSASGLWKEETGKRKLERGNWKEETGKRKLERGNWKWVGVFLRGK
jgi:hypothetical protein